MPDDYEWWGPKGDEMWLSTRGLAPDSNDKSPCRLWTEWVSKFGRFNFAAGNDESPSGLRTVDQRFNPIVVDCPCVASTLDEVWELLDVNKWLPKPIPESEYTLLFMDSEGSSSLLNHPRLKLLGYDLTDMHWSWSTLQDPNMWCGDLEAVAVRRGENGA